MARFPRSLSLVPRLQLPGASQDENDTDYETLIRHLLEGQCSNPVRVVAFNTEEGWSRDVSDDVADELRDAAPSAERCQTFFSTFWRPMILAGQAQLPSR